jgi:NAD(P)-dependent dehydrogenase (short-subunit alcohol dehydrogenase family)
VHASGGGSYRTSSVVPDEEADEGHSGSTGGAPGPVWTPLNAADRDADAVSKFGSETPMKRPARPEEIAPAFVFLASAAKSRTRPARGTAKRRRHGTPAATATARSNPQE